MASGPRLEIVWVDLDRQALAGVEVLDEDGHFGVRRVREGNLADPPFAGGTSVRNSDLAPRLFTQTRSQLHFDIPLTIFAIDTATTPRKWSYKAGLAC
jgi:hypothetical protein